MRINNWLFLSLPDLEYIIRIKPTALKNVAIINNIWVISNIIIDFITNIIPVEYLPYNYNYSLQLLKNLMIFNLLMNQFLCKNETNVK